MPTPGFESLIQRFDHQLQQVAALDVRVPEDSALNGLASNLWAVAEKREMM